MIKTFRNIAMALIAALVVFSTFAPFQNVSAAALNGTTAYEYEAKLANSGGTIKLLYDQKTQVLAVAVFENGDAAGYSATGVVNPVGEFTMNKATSFSDGTGLYEPAESITVEVLSMTASKATFAVTFSDSASGKYRASVVTTITDELRPGVCSNPSGTGACNQVNTDGDWWRCFRCCLVTMGSGCN